MVTKIRRRGFERRCFKKKIKSERAAKKVLSDTRKKGREEIRYYWCYDCGAYHLTSKKRVLLKEDPPIEENGIDEIY